MSSIEHHRLSHRPPADLLAVHKVIGQSVGCRYPSLARRQDPRSRAASRFRDIHEIENGRLDNNDRWQPRRMPRLIDAMGVMNGHTMMRATYVSLRGDHDVDAFVAAVLIMKAMDMRCRFMTERSTHATTQQRGPISRFFVEWTGEHGINASMEALPQTGSDLRTNRVATHNSFELSA